MKDSEVYLRAAEAALIGDAYYILSVNGRSGRLTAFFNGHWPSGSHEEQEEQRCMAPCFMAAIAQSEGR